MKGLYAMFLALAMPAAMMAQDTLKGQKGDLSTLPGLWVMDDYYVEAPDGTRTDGERGSFTKYFFHNGCQYFINSDESSKRYSIYEMLPGDTLRENDARVPLRISGDSLHQEWRGDDGRLWVENWRKVRTMVMIDTPNPDVACMVLMPRWYDRQQPMHVTPPVYTEGDPYAVSYALAGYDFDHGSWSPDFSRDVLVKVGADGKGEYKMASIILGMGKNKVARPLRWPGVQSVDKMAAPEWIPATVDGKPCSSFLIYRVNTPSKDVVRIGNESRENARLHTKRLVGVWKSDNGRVAVFSNPFADAIHIHGLNGFCDMNADFESNIYYDGAMAAADGKTATIDGVKHRFEILDANRIMLDGQLFCRHDKASASDEVKIFNYHDTKVTGDGREDLTIALTDTVVVMPDGKEFDTAKGDRVADAMSKVKSFSTTKHWRTAWIHGVVEKDGTMTGVKVVRSQSKKDARFIADYLKTHKVNPVVDRDGDRVRCAMLREVRLEYYYIKAYSLNIVE